MQQGLAIVVSLWAVLYIGGVRAQYQCMMKTGGKLCTLIKSSDVASTTDATVVDPANCVMLQAIPTFQYCNREHRQESCLGVNCNIPCRVLMIDDCTCDVLIAGPVKNECMARYQADYIASLQNVPADSITVDIAPDSSCAGQNRGALQKHTCTANDPICN